MGDWFNTETLQTVLEGAAYVISGAAVLATLTPNKTDDKITQFIADVVNFLGANFGKARNDPDNK